MSWMTCRRCACRPCQCRRSAAVAALDGLTRALGYLAAGACIWAAVIVTAQTLASLSHARAEIDRAHIEEIAR